MCIIRQVKLSKSIKYKQKNGNTNKKGKEKHIRKQQKTKPWKSCESTFLSRTSKKKIVPLLNW